MIKAFFLRETFLKSFIILSFINKEDVRVEFISMICVVCCIRGRLLSNHMQKRKRTKKPTLMESPGVPGNPGRPS